MNVSFEESFDEQARQVAERTVENMNARLALRGALQARGMTTVVQGTVLPSPGIQPPGAARTLCYGDSYGSYPMGSD